MKAKSIKLQPLVLEYQLQFSVVNRKHHHASHEPDVVWTRGGGHVRGGSYIGNVLLSSVLRNNNEIVQMATTDTTPLNCKWLA